MRTTFDDATVRLYYLHPEAGTAQTLFYGTLVEALNIADQQEDAVQDGLFLQTSNDVVAYRDFIEG